MADLQVKTCGITNLADARYCVSVGASFLGFIQYPDSPRYVGPSVAAEIIKWVSGVQTVGVFVDEDVKRVNDIAAQTGFDFVQLHGNESADYCCSVLQPVIKVFRVKEDDTASDLIDRMASYKDCAEYFMLDTFSNHAPGGTGKTLGWDVAADVARDHTIFLAGGLNAGNVARAAGVVDPFAVDVASGIESSPGTKDFEAIDAFFAALEEVTQ